VHSLGFVISQSKWIVFADGRRRLLDFDRIEAAGLGPLGSLHLLFNLKVSDISVVRASALLTVLAVAMDPFAQQLLQFRQQTPSSTTTQGTLTSPAPAVTQRVQKRGYRLRQYDMLKATRPVSLEGATSPSPPTPTFPCNQP